MPSTNDHTPPQSRCCPEHGRDCVGFARSDQPPTNGLDLADRIVTLAASGHFRKAHVVTALVFLVVLTAAAGALIVLARASPWPYLALAGAIGGSAACVKVARALHPRAE